MSKNTSVSLSQELYDRAMKRAADEYIFSFSSLVRVLLTKYVEEQ